MKIKPTIGHRPQSKHFGYTYRRVAIMAVMAALVSLCEVATVWGTSGQSLDDNSFVDTISSNVTTKVATTKNNLII